MFIPLRIQSSSLWLRTSKQSKWDLLKGDRMFYPVGVALLLAVLGLLLLLLWHRRTHGVSERKAERDARRTWTGVCPKSNPETNDRCEREEFHLKHHCH